jgi:hypothetical protein
MRSVNFVVRQKNIQELARHPQGKLMRTYRTVTLSSYNNFEFEHLGDLELNLLQNVESLKFDFCTFQDTVQFMSVLKHCKHLKYVCTDRLMFADLKSEPPTQKFQNPVSLSISSPSCKSLDCFANIVHITIHGGKNLDLQDVALFMGNHGGAVKTMNILEQDSDDFLQLLVNTPDLKLKHLNFYAWSDHRHAKLLVHQKSSLTKLVVAGAIVQPMFQAIHLNLVNLETLVLCVVLEHNVCLSELKALPKLKSLHVYFWAYFEDGYELDIGECSSLMQLKLTNFYAFKLVFKRPNVALKKLELMFPVNSQLLGQIPQSFPNLVSLELGSYVSIY